MDALIIVLPIYCDYQEDTMTYDNNVTGHLSQPSHISAGFFVSFYKMYIYMNIVTIRKVYVFLRFVERHLADGLMKPVMGHKREEVEYISHWSYSFTTQTHVWCVRAREYIKVKKET